MENFSPEANAHLSRRTCSPSRKSMTLSLGYLSRLNSPSKRKKPRLRKAKRLLPAQSPTSGFSPGKLYSDRHVNDNVLFTQAQLYPECPTWHPFLRAINSQHFKHSNTHVLELENPSRHTKLNGQTNPNFRHWRLNSANAS